MRSVGIKVLKNRLSDYLRIVSTGETVLVTDRDRVVAELVPPAPGRSPLLSDALLADAVRLGYIRPALRVSTQPPPSLPVASTEQILRELDEDRSDR
jgi:prevent-host-death family protein